MKERPPKQLVLARERLDKVGQQIDQLGKISRQDIEDVAEKYSKQKSSFLAGIAGGVIGAGAGVGVASALGATVVIGGPAGLLLGAALAVLAWRGKGYHQTERLTEQIRILLDAIRREISELEDAPEDVRRELWDTYKAAVVRYRAVVLQSLSGGGEGPMEIEAKAVTIENSPEGIPNTS